MKIMSIKCSFCDEIIHQDRYNIALTLERQDFPGKSNWQKSVDSYKEDVCPKCEQKIVDYYDNFTNYLRNHKGKLPEN